MSKKIKQINFRTEPEKAQFVNRIAEMADVKNQDCLACSLAFALGSKDALVLAVVGRMQDAVKQLRRSGEPMPFNAEPLPSPLFAEVDTHIANEQLNGIVGVAGSIPVDSTTGKIRGNGDNDGDRVDMRRSTRAGANVDGSHSRDPSVSPHPARATGGTGPPPHTANVRSHNRAPGGKGIKRPVAKLRARVAAILDPLFKVHAATA